GLLSAFTCFCTANGAMLAAAACQEAIASFNTGCTGGEAGLSCGGYWGAGPGPGRGKKIPLRSCPISEKVLPGTLVAKSPRSAKHPKPSSCAPRQVTVTWFSKKLPVKPFSLSLTLTCRVTGPFQTTSKLTLASTDGPSASALGKSK